MEVVMFRGSTPPFSIALSPRQREKLRRVVQKLDATEQEVLGMFVDPRLDSDGETLRVRGADPRAGRRGPGRSADDILTAAEVAAVLRVDEQDVVDMAMSGQLRGNQVAGQWRFTWGAVQQWAWGDGA
jgi:hypothetical protein